MTVEQQIAKGLFEEPEQSHRDQRSAQQFLSHHIDSVRALLTACPGIDPIIDRRHERLDTGSAQVDPAFEGKTVLADRCVKEPLDHPINHLSPRQSFLAHSWPVQAATVHEYTDPHFAGAL